MEHNAFTHTKIELNEPETSHHGNTQFRPSQNGMIQGGNKPL